VATCRPGQRVGDLRVEDDLCVVVNDERIVLGDLRGKALKADPSTPVEDIMNPGPSTYRPNVSVTQMAHHLIKTGARKVLVSDADGHLLGWLSFQDVLNALDRRREASHA
jgi:predicted transcriptional regulator